ncbi:MAG: nucleotidyltransferase domain-containing protein [Nanopusillaceae archaeon]
MDNLKDEILNSEYRDRILSIVEFKEKDQNILELLKGLMNYSNVIVSEDIFEKFKREIETYKHWVVVISDFDLKPDEKIKLKTDFITKYLEIIKNNKMDIWLHVLLIEDIKGISMDSRFELIDLLSLGNVLYDKGFIEIIKLTSVHKKLIIDLLQRYVVAYVLAGSQVKGRSIESSDIDVYVVIDDTDVKQHTFEELKAKLISIITEKAMEAKLITGSKKILHPQVYTLTEYWLSLSESNPVIITFLRDGIALYDRGMFIAWKQLLLKGIIKPSQEASEKYINAAETAIKEAREKLKNTINNLIIEDLAVAMITVGQSVIMDYGLLPGDPKETPEMLRKLFVERGLLDNKYVNDLEEVWKMRKDFEHGLVNEYKYEDLMKVFEKADKFISEMKNLKQIIDKENEKKIIDNYLMIYETLKNKFKELFNEELLNYIEKNISVELNGIKELEDNIQKYKNKQFDLIEMEKFKEEILYYTRFIRNLIEDKKEEIIMKYKYTIIDKEKNKSYDIYLNKSKIYIVKDEGIEIYDYNGNKIGTMNDINYKEEMIKELSKEGVEYIDNNIMNTLSKIFKDFAISK